MNNKNTTESRNQPNRDQPTTTIEAFSSLVQLIKKSSYCVAFTGAGVSTLSGIPDFRGKEGFYKTGGNQDMFDINLFLKNPSVYYTAAKDFIYGLDSKTPSIVHTTLALLEQKNLLHAVITQNVDLLHTKAGSKIVYEIHGSPSIHRCLKCNKTKTFEDIAPIAHTGNVPMCDYCNRALKPDITFFGEALPSTTINKAIEASQNADLMLVLGSSLTVYPAASLPEHALQHGAKLVIINEQPTHLDRLAHLHLSDLQTSFEYLLNAFS